MKYIRRLILEKALNYRELGGFSCAEGGCTRYGVFLRGGCPFSLTKKDMDVLIKHGMRCVVDLRAEEEADGKPSPFLSHTGIRYFRISLLDSINLDGFAAPPPALLSELYISMLESSRKQIAMAMEILADCEGAALFHCTAGKDRTGVIAMLLLKLAGVSDPDVLADYAVSSIYAKPIFDSQRLRLSRTGRQVPEHIFQSLPEDMQPVLDYLSERFGDAKAYLLSIGLSEGVSETLRRKLVETS